MQRSLVFRQLRRCAALVATSAEVQRLTTYPFVCLPMTCRAMHVARAAPALVCPMRMSSTAGESEEAGSRTAQYLLDRNDVLNRVMEVVKNFEKVDAAKVTPESHFVNDLGLNSLDVVEVVFAIEQEFILDIPDHDAEKIQSIPDAVEYIAQNPMAK